MKTTCYGEGKRVVLPLLTSKTDNTVQQNVCSKVSSLLQRALHTRVVLPLLMSKERQQAEAPMGSAVTQTIPWLSWGRWEHLQTASAGRSRTPCTAVLEWCLQAQECPAIRHTVSNWVQFETPDLTLTGAGVQFLWCREEYYTDN